MFDKISKVIIGLLGMLLGYSILSLFVTLRIVTIPRSGWGNLVLYLGISLLFGIILFFFIIKNNK